MNKFNSTAKTNFYYSNGTGRDTYILENSGGLTHVRRPQSASSQSSRFMTFSLTKRTPFNSSAKVIHYASDGSGRDNYIITNAGGLMSKTQKNTNFAYNFREVLRNYEKPEKIGLYTVNAEDLRRLKEKQRKNSDLLSQPRRKNVPFGKLLENARISVEKSIN